MIEKIHLPGFAVLLAMTAGGGAATGTQATEIPKTQNRQTCPAILARVTAQWADLLAITGRFTDQTSGHISWPPVGRNNWPLTAGPPSRVDK